MSREIKVLHYADDFSTDYPALNKKIVYLKEQIDKEFWTNLKKSKEVLVRNGGQPGLGVIWYFEELKSQIVSSPRFNLYIICPFKKFLRKS